VTTLFWGAGATLQFIVLEWAEAQPELNLSPGGLLQGVVAVGMALGAVLAAKMITLRRSVRCFPLGIAMGLVVIVMIFVTNYAGRHGAADPDRRAGGLLRGADECAAAAPRPRADGRRPLDRGAELQREPVDPGDDRALLRC
jgi:hypothetical protein